MSRELQVEGISVSYGDVTALTDVTLHVAQGEIIALLGANGAGKSTTLKAVMGMVKPHEGKILLDGMDVTGLPAHTAARRGVALVPEGRRIFKKMTVRENLEVGGVTQPASKAAMHIEEVYALFPRLRERQRQLAGTMSGGEQQMLAIGRALMSKPAFILLDEPSLGLAPLITAQVYEVIKRISTELGIGSILVEQNVELALSVATRGYVLARGKEALAGPAASLLGSPALHRAYLGM
ncbi:ABC transporter ATP-binding protein [Burkholderia sp. L27(2015)]|uniref:ABC transporter ATP-binding protein n=1 Tax=Burkholderia sp. L27(2015) TaxID=1641858 RepID=UPI00131ECE52|nr:ABC transporter ATP-binding protein [Burkholderia sp. L27(2015)]